MEESKVELTREELDALYRKAGIRLVIMIAVFVLIAVLVSGRWDWWFAWAYIALSLVNTVVYLKVMYDAHPDLLHERLTAPKRGKSWDKAIVSTFGLGMPVVWIVASLDIRNGWSVPAGLWIQSLCFVLGTVGLVIADWAVRTNRFFSSLVRIQTDRGHKVVDTGPYAIIRHPGYTGTLLYYLTLPVGLGSYWAMIPVVLLALLFVFRTWKEDGTLQEELEGYKEYTQRVRFRLVPGIW